MIGASTPVQRWGTHSSTSLPLALTHRRSNPRRTIGAWQVRHRLLADTLQVLPFVWSVGRGPEQVAVVAHRDQMCRVARSADAHPRLVLDVVERHQVERVRRVPVAERVLALVPLVEDGRHAATIPGEDVGAHVRGDRVSMTETPGPPSRRLRDRISTHVVPSTGTRPGPRWAPCGFGR